MLLVIVLLLVLGAVSVVLGQARAHKIVYPATAILALWAIINYFEFLAVRGQLVDARVIALGVPYIAMNLRMDSLAAWFGLVINLAGLAAAVYGMGYGPHNDEPARVLSVFPVFLAAMNLVLIADDAFTFLLAWEFMSVASWLLVMANHRRAGTARAAQVYLVMAVLGTACLLLAFGLMAGPGGAYRFAEMRAQPAAGMVGGVALALALLGTASKAGLAPLHAWLPIAHPAAPSHVSALMSGAMTKVALYGLARIFFDLAGPVHWGWGAVLVAIGVSSALLGVLHALLERDLKALLAWSTVENVGVIALGMGLALIFRASALDSLAALALAAALLHVLNHALMKSLLFFVAGAVETATGRRDLEALGGLIHRMTVTAALALIGCAAIAALPPFNGFVSEWLMFQAILQGPALQLWALKFAVPLAGALLALSTALAATCFVRVFGMVFLGRPRSAEAASAADVAPAMRAAMIGLAGLCVLIGVLPTLAVATMMPAIQRLSGARLSVFADGFSLSELLWFTPVAAETSSYSGLVVLLVVLLVTLAGVRGVHRLASNRIRRSPAWDCGFPDPSPATQYTASSFAQPVRRVFGEPALAARERIDMPGPGEMRPARMQIALHDPVWRILYAPVERLVAWLGAAMNALQFLSIRRYLTLMFAALVLLLIAVVATQ
jgi:hydrogenase-4 component B